MDQIFTCQQWKIDRAIAHNATSFCIAEKSLLISSILIAFLICQQLYVYEVLLRVKISDLRILILLMCIFNQINNFIHYNLKASQQCSTFITIEMFRFIIFFTLMYHFCVQASGLFVINKRKLLIGLRIMLVVSVVVIAFFGVVVNQEIEDSERNDSVCTILPDNICFVYLYKLVKYFSIFTCIIFYFIFRRIFFLV